jgi:hypothetical protein
MAKSALITSILENHTVVGYLESKGYGPKSSLGHRLKYCCPIHDEKTPSFYVFTHKEYQYYHCFGCKAHGDVINLVAAMESLSIKEAIGRLARGLSIDAEDATDRLADEIEDAYEKTDLTIEDIALRLSRSVYGYLESTGFDPIEVALMEKVLQKTDRMVVALDLHDLQESYDKIVDEGIPARTIAYLKRKEQEEAAKYGRAKVHAP